MARKRRTARQSAASRRNLAKARKRRRVRVGVGVGVGVLAVTLSTRSARQSYKTARMTGSDRRGGLRSARHGLGYTFHIPTKDRYNYQKDVNRKFKKIVKNGGFQ
jgi:hypothetical protein